MTIDEVIRRIEEVGIIPVVRAASVEEATRAVEAISAGGIPVVEITMTVPNAVSVIREVAQQYGDKVLIGAGTVTTGEQAESCLRAGAEFLVSPGLAASVLSVAHSAGKLAIPGALTPTELMNAQDARRSVGQDFSLRKRRRTEISAVAESPVPAGQVDSDRRRERRQRRRLHRCWSVRVGSWRGLSRSGSVARRQF